MRMPGGSRAIAQRYPRPAAICCRLKPFIASIWVAQTSASANGGGISTPSAPTITCGIPLSVSVDPTASLFIANRRDQNRRESTTVACCPGRSSASPNPEPTAIGTPSRSKKLAVTRTPGSCSGVASAPVRLNVSYVYAERRSNNRSRAASSENEANEIVASRMSRFGFACVRVTMRSAFRNGSGRRRTASTTLKTAVLAPTPSAIVATATAENVFAFHNERIAYRMLISQWRRS